ncbi:52 kDa repressor of the inhibitor of the protein kinase [Mycetomoellerius zeteki]|uniref:52 kDa repressor of the inhibitor of the protein kinase n=1 Tax=Mycetomoellerius zeteki TaxID=64791 RepID=UPI00084EB288|nr:PREDICTED: 52 kDa repressor of the inhibitor of the protein kinase-like [Trachymyrmex zeteki]
MEKMLAQKSNGWCVVKECNKNNVEKRHLFRFPKEHDRCLQWIRACDRLDLEAMGAEYAHCNYRVCHLHFEEKWYNISKTRAHLHPDAIPTKFFERNNESITTTLVKINDEEKINDEIPIEDNICISEHDKINRISPTIANQSLAAFSRENYYLFSYCVYIL